MIDIGQHRWREPGSFPFQDLAAKKQFCAFLLRIGDLSFEHAKLGLARDRADICGFIQRISDLVPFDFRDEGVDERVVDRFVHIDALDRAT